MVICIMLAIVFEQHWVLEQPSSSVMAATPWFLHLRGIMVVFESTTWMSEFGADTAKPTRVLYWGAELACLGAKCTHPPSWLWCEYFNASGHPVKQQLWRAHPQLVKSRDAKGCWLSKAAAAYPAALNQAIAVAVAGTGVCQKQ